MSVLLRAAKFAMGAGVCVWGAEKGVLTCGNKVVNVAKVNCVAAEVGLG